MRSTLFLPLSFEEQRAEVRLILRAGFLRGMPCSRGDAFNTGTRGTGENRGTRAHAHEFFKLIQLFN